MRTIDADQLADGLKLHRQPTGQKYETDRQWAVGYNAGLERALYSIAHAPTLTPPNEPLTCVGCYWQTHGSIGKCIDCVREKTDNYYRCPPEGEEDT